MCSKGCVLSVGRRLKLSYSSVNAPICSPIHSLIHEPFIHELSYNSCCRGLPINSGNYDQRTTLHLASAEGNDKVVELLLK